MGSSAECFVPDCNNARNDKNNEKRFIKVPNFLKTREQWFKAAYSKLKKKEIRVEPGPLVCCEDHFDLITDVTGRWLRTESMSPGNTFKLKRGVVPHIFPNRSVQGKKLIKPSRISDQPVVKEEIIEEGETTITKVQAEDEKVSDGDQELSPSKNKRRPEFSKGNSVKIRDLKPKPSPSSSIAFQIPYNVQRSVQLTESSEDVDDPSSSTSGESGKKKQKVVKEILAWIPSNPNASALPFPALEVRSNSEASEKSDGVSAAAKKYFLLVQNQLQPPAVALPSNPSTAITTANSVVTQKSPCKRPASPPPLLPVSHPKSSVDFPSRGGIIMSPGLSMVQDEFSEMKERIRLLTGEVKSLKAEVTRLRGQAAAHFTTPPRFHQAAVEKRVNEVLGKILTKNQITALLSPKSCRVTWSEEDMYRAVALRSISPKAYRYLRTTLKFPFPAPSSIRRYLYHEQQCVEVRRTTADGVTEVYKVPEEGEDDGPLEDEYFEAGEDEVEEAEFEEQDFRPHPADFSHVSHEVTLEED